MMYNKKQESILDAALKVFQEHGYDGASMDNIAEAASASKRTVYNYFQGKELLFQSVLERFMQEAMELKQIEYSSSRALSEQLGDFIEAKRTTVRNPAWLALMRVTLSVSIQQPEIIADVMQRAQQVDDALASWLRCANEDGRMQVPDPGLAASVFWSMAGGAFFWPVLFNSQMPENKAEQLKAELIRTFLSSYQHVESNRAK